MNRGKRTKRKGRPSAVLSTESQLFAVLHPTQNSQYQSPDLGVDHAD
jgi:hypothetical protein